MAKEQGGEVMNPEKMVAELEIALQHEAPDDITDTIGRWMYLLGWTCVLAERNIDD